MKKQELIEMLSRVLEEAINLPDDAEVKFEESEVSYDGEYGEEYYSHSDYYDIYISDMRHIDGFYTMQIC